jgi:dUTP pyrophosphatase
MQGSPRLEVKIKREPGGEGLELPCYQTPGAAGMDVRAAGDMVVEPMGTVLVPTGFSIAVPIGYEAQLRPRSGLALKHGITLLNSPGTIDCDYRGEVKILLTNLGQAPFSIRRGDRIAQMVVAAYSRVEWSEVDELDETGRAAGGFGHSGAS